MAGDDGPGAGSDSRVAGSPPGTGADVPPAAQRVAERLEIERDVAHGLIAMAAILPEALADDPLELRRAVVREAFERRRLDVQHVGDDIRGRPAVEGRMAGHELVEHRADGPDIGARVDRLRRGPAPATCTAPCRQCRRPVDASTEWVDSPAAITDSGRIFASPKSRILTSPSARTITFSGLTSRCTTPASWAAARPSASWRPMSTASREIERLAVQSPQRGAVHVLHDDEAPAVGKLAERVDRADVRVIERRGAARLALEAGKTRGVAREGRGQDLHGDLAAEPAVPREVHLAHPAPAERAENLAIAEDVAGSQHSDRIMPNRSGPCQLNRPQHLTRNPQL